MLNDKYKRVNKIIENINSINIYLKFKPRDTFKREFFFIYKKTIFYRFLYYL